MAARGGLILAALAAIAAIMAGRKKNGLATVAPIDPDEKEGGAAEAEMVPPPIPFPENWYERFMGGYKPAVDKCFNELGMVNDIEIRACALDKIFPEAPWPPPTNSHQWQRNVWHNKEFVSYVRSKYPPPT
jgi:hypothetical protein